MAEIVMPRLSDTMEEGTILRWLINDGESVSRATGSATNHAMTHARERATRKSSVLHANPGRRRSRVQRPTRCLPSPNRSRARSRKANTPKVVGVAVGAVAAGNAESALSKASHAHRAASAASVDPRRTLPLARAALHPRK